MRFYNLVAYLLFLSPLVSSKDPGPSKVPEPPKILYIDESCKQQVDWSKYWDEAQKFARGALKRMNSKTDEDFADVFFHIFKVEPEWREADYVASKYSNYRSCVKLRLTFVCRNFHTHDYIPTYFQSGEIRH
jgi:hypothetical protein